MAAKHRTVTVLGGGKTSIDSLSWLLGNGYPADAISWVVPRDSRFLNRACTEPGLEFFEQTFGGGAENLEICATATNVEDLCTRMEAAGIWFRLDPGVWPRMFHSAVLSEREMEAVRSIRRTIRLGRVNRIEPHRLVLEGGVEDAKSDTLYIDCTASAVAQNVGIRTPVFS